MLILTRKPGERLILGNGDIVIEVTEIRGGKVKIGIEAPRDVPILRSELIEDEDWRREIYR